MRLHQLLEELGLLQEGREHFSILSDGSVEKRSGQKERQEVRDRRRGKEEILAYPRVWSSSELERKRRKGGRISPTKSRRVERSEPGRTPSLDRVRRVGSGEHRSLVRWIWVQWLEGMVEKREERRRGEGEDVPLKSKSREVVGALASGSAPVSTSEAGF